MDVVAAMSDGVNSAVAAACALEQGHDAISDHLALSRSPGLVRAGSRGCCSLELELHRPLDGVVRGQAAVVYRPDEARDIAATHLVNLRSIGKLAACLAAAPGAGGVAAQAIAAACAGACALTDPTASRVVWAVCVGGCATLGAGGMPAVVGIFQL